MRQQHERRIRGGVIMAELGPVDLERFLAACQRERRTTGFLGGRIISDWLKRRDEATYPPDKKQSK
jgi:hypothetical protein